MIKTLEIDARTGEQTVTEREPTQEELDQSVVDQAAAQAREAEISARIARRETALTDRVEAIVTRAEFRALQGVVRDLALLIDPPIEPPQER